jgi:ketosteroid isomerase-like protein
MKINYKLSVILLLITIVAERPALAQSGTDEASVWTAVERQWRAFQRNDKNWVNDMLTTDFVGWPSDSPAPRNRSSTRLWAEFDARRTETLEYELYPMSIVVHGDLAVAHYLFTTATQDKGAEPQKRSGRFTDVLVRADGVWKFISWHGGLDP